MYRSKGGAARTPSAKPYIYVNETEIYSRFKNRFGVQMRDPERAIYPACGADATPSRVFSKIMFLDPDRDAIELLKGRGGIAVDGGLELIRHGSADCVIARRPPYYIIPAIFSIVAKGGFLLTPLGYNPTSSVLCALDEMPAAGRARSALPTFIFVESLLSRGTAKICQKHRQEFLVPNYDEELAWGVWKRAD
ncbi:MAG: hypothetical protein LVQ95_04045 [Candidatus Micrarchaeales archaeon]|nr:hypothetical protein [Candidatus Micrarchaeales archaeon]